MDKDYHKDRLERDRAIEEILFSDDIAVGKVQRIMDLGVEEETADDLVDRFQIGQAAPVYYERLHIDDETY